LGAKGSLLFLLLCLLTARAAAATTTQPSDWRLPNLNWSSTRAVSASPIDAADVAHLRVRWRYVFANSRISDSTPVPEVSRGVVATPLVVGDSVFIQDATSAVFALNRATGALRWVHSFAAPNFGRNGLSYSSGSLYASTDTTVFALSGRTGQMLWERRLVTATQQYVDVAPLIADNLVFIATVGYPPGGKGVLYALDAHDGAIVWKFTTIRGEWAHPQLAGGGGVWYTPSLGANGVLYTGVANPYPFGGLPKYPNGSVFAGDALYTDSLLALDVHTGHLLWYDQVTPHDFRDYDFQLPPILSTLTVAGRSEQAVIGGGKAGEVVAWNASSHARLWTARVGEHLNDLGPLPAHRVTVCPGFYGGIETPMALSAGTLFVPVVNLCVHGSATSYQAIGTLNPTSGSGEFVALDASDGHVLWQRKLPQPDYGCATAADGVVFTSTWDGHLYGFDAATGKLLWQAQSSAGINGCPALSGKLLLVPAGIQTSKMRHVRFELVAYAVP
jgi:alcohol dehydrogenase (cytochrome c)